MSLAARMLAAFEGSKVAHGTTTVGRIGRNGKAESDSRIVRRPLTLELIQSHIDGVQGIGAIPINEENMCRWGAIDVDVYNLDHASLQARIQKLKLPLLHCRSKSGGAHLYLFLQDYEQAKVVREYLVEMSVALGHSGCEIFPKQDRILAERGDVGNFINMPYFNADTPQRYCFNDEGNAMELEEFLDAVEERAIPVSSLEKLQFSGKRKYFVDGPPCLEHIFADGPISADRNKTVFNCGVYSRLKHPDDWVAEFETMNRTLCDPPLESKEVVGLQKSLEKKEYFYTCDQEPFKSFCDKDLCMTRRYGIGDKSVESATMGNLLIVLSEPRLYFLNVDGQRVQLSTEQLQNQTQFQRACMEQITVMPPTMRGNRWQATVQKLLKEAVRQEVPEELTLTGQFMEHLRQFCTSRIRALHPEELLHGKPWTNNQGVTMFKFDGLMDYLAYRKFTYYTRAQVQEQLKRLNGGRECHHTHNITRADGSRTTVRVWTVPAFENIDIKLPIEEITNDIPF